MSNKANPIRIGIIGAGGNTRAKHIPGLQAIEGVEILGVANRTEESARKVAQQFDLARTYPHWRAVIDDPEVNAVVIGTWPYMHAPITIAALEAGKHVMCEARMACDAVEARAMFAASRRRPELVAQIVPSPFTLPVDATIGRFLAGGELGPLLAVELRDTKAVIDRQAPRTWRQDATLSGMNILSMGIWYEALMRWVGPASRIAAMGRTFVKQRPDADGNIAAVDVPDHVDVLGELCCGAQLHMQISAVMGLPEQSGAWLVGENGVLHVAASGDRLAFRQHGEKEFAAVSLAPELVGQWRVEAEFIAAIRGQETIKLTDFFTALRYMEFTEAVTRSMQSGHAVSLPL